MGRWIVLGSFLLCACGGPGRSTGDSGPAVSLGTEHTGSYNLGPVDFAETEWHNACAPYPGTIQSLTGEMLAGVSNGVGTGDYCDACIQIDTAMGRSIVARVVTYGDTMGAGDLDLSPQAYAAINQNEFPRTMRWHLVTCPTTDPLYYQYQTGANIWWTSLWVRNPRIAIDRVEVRSANHAQFTALRRGTDGTFTDDGGFGEGEFTLRVVGVDGSTSEETFSSFTPGDLVRGSRNL
jgi:hypothetical protein